MACLNYWRKTKSKNEKRNRLQSDIWETTFKICVLGGIINDSADKRDHPERETRNDQSYFHYLYTEVDWLICFFI